VIGMPVGDFHTDRNTGTVYVVIWDGAHLDSNADLLTPMSHATVQAGAPQRTSGIEETRGRRRGPRPARS
jgi:hypothetical protein